jgi:DNA polymerase III gamma/tau subunit
MAAMSTSSWPASTGPSSFAQMVGQEHVVQALSNALPAAAPAPRLLFTGTRGIGKTTVSAASWPRA